MLAASPLLKKVPLCNRGRAENLVPEFKLELMPSTTKHPEITQQLFQKQTFKCLDSTAKRLLVLV
ncbi:hypothetical protein K7432_009948 [Basidiobolus ranarum]|uniref:Uncharacterized protein n=1 Tax=Basidiobolus ranarum TaxID=34480 RepID=A0ABR2VW93_9FUNG